MSRIDALRNSFPESARDLAQNLQSVLADTSLNPSQAYGVAIASAIFTASDVLRETLTSDARDAGVSEDMLDDAHAAAALMTMTGVYYRFRHMVENPAFERKPARLRMQRMMKPATSKLDLELCAMACAALAGCQLCIKAHDTSIRKAGGSEDQIHDAVRTAAVVSGAATALRSGAQLGGRESERID